MLNQNKIILKIEDYFQDEANTIGHCFNEIGRPSDVILCKTDQVFRNYKYLIDLYINTEVSKFNYIKDLKYYHHDKILLIIKQNFRDIYEYNSFGFKNVIVFTSNSIDFITLTHTN